MDSIEKLYKCYEILSEAGDKIVEYESEYREILVAVKGSSKEKRLASQFIGKFFKFFPNLADLAIDAQLDLCEDEDVQIRRQAVRDLPRLCKDTREHTPKISDTLAQLLVLDDTTELQQVTMSLQASLKCDAIGTLAGIFSQINSGDEITRERCFKFLATKVTPLGLEVVTKDVEDFIIEKTKKVLQDVTAEEFHLCMNILRSTRLGNSITGHAELVKLATEQAELGAEIDAITIDDEIIERFIQCASYVMPYFSPQIKATPFILFVCDKLLPLSTWTMIGTAERQNQIQLRLLKTFAEMCAFCGSIENAPKRIEAIYNVLLEYMPLPKLDDDGISNSPSFQFSHTECLLYTLHAISKQNPESLTFVDDPIKLKDFRSRLQFLARGTQGYIKKLQEAVKDKTSDELKTEENHLKVTALKTTSNISILIRDLFHSPPSFKTEIQLSWIMQKNTQLVGKRHTPITFGFDNKKQKIDTKKQRFSSDQRVYQPPSGKYSAKVTNYYGNRLRSQTGGSRSFSKKKIKNY